MACISGVYFIDFGRSVMHSNILWLDEVYGLLPS